MGIRPGLTERDSVCAVLGPGWPTVREAASALHLHAVGLGESAASPKLGQQPVLQVDNRLPDLFVFGEEVVVIEGNLQVLLQRQSAGQLEHPIAGWGVGGRRGQLS